MQTTTNPLLADHWPSLFEGMSTKTFKRGQTVFCRDDPGDGLYLVDKGRVRISIMGADGRELSFTIVEPGMIFGEIAALDGKLRTADALAMTSVSVRFIPDQQLNAMIDNRPGLAREIIVFLCDRLRSADTQLESIALMTLESRIAAFLLVLVRNQEPAQGDIPFNLSQAEFAKLLGASRPKVNAVLKKFTEDGIVSFSEGRMTCDVAALRRATES